jgi:hypothetical protein
MRTAIACLALATSLAWLPVAQGAQPEQTPQPQKTAQPQKAAQAQKNFATPEEAAAALVAGVRAADRAATLAVLGNAAASFVTSGDAVADRAMFARFLEDYQTRNAIETDGDRATLIIGAERYPFAFPIVKSGERWRFDTAAGREELLARRIGENELHAIEVLRAVVDAQLEYASEDRNGNGSLEYAQRLASTPGKRDGLYWQAKAGEPPSPLGALVAEAATEGYAKQKKPQPFHGYFYKPLRGQGSDALTGPLDYVVRGRAIGGFALVAWPANYGNSGVMTFIVNHEGTVYEKDLGPGTQAAASSMTRFNPGKGWTRVPAR